MNGNTPITDKAKEAITDKAKKVGEEVASSEVVKIISEASEDIKNAATSFDTGLKSAESQESHGPKETPPSPSKITGGRKRRRKSRKSRRRKSRKSRRSRRRKSKRKTRRRRKRRNRK